MAKKLFALILVILMILPSIVSCGGKTQKPGGGINYDETGNNGGSVDGTEDDPLIAVINDHVADIASQVKFKGETFTWLGPAGWQAPEKDEETGDAVSDAMYFRQREIEDALGITWVNNRARTSGAGDTSSPTVDMIKQDVMAGTGAYDAAYAGNMHTQQLLINNSLMNLTDFTTMDLENEWWPQDLQGSLSIGGELYFLTGPIVTTFYTDAKCMVFNKQVAEDYGIDGLYDIVRDGDWTFDKMIEVASVIPDNANGAGAYRYAGADGVAITIAHGYTLTDFDENGNPFIPENLPQGIVDMADKYSVIFSDDAQSVNLKGLITSNYQNFEEKYGYEGIGEMFEDDKILFNFTDTAGVASLRLRDVDFGVLPMPKGYDTMENYISYGSGHNVFVPKSAKNPQMTDVVFEIMAALGYKYFKPTCYDNMLKSRSVKDFESKDMLDIIFATKKYDIIDVVDKGATINGDGQIVTLFNGAIQESSDSFVSRYFLNSKMVNAGIKQILANIAADIND